MSKASWLRFSFLPFSTFIMSSPKRSLEKRGKTLRWDCCLLSHTTKQVCVTCIMKTVGKGRGGGGFRMVGSFWTGLSLSTSQIVATLYLCCCGPPVPCCYGPPVPCCYGPPVPCCYGPPVPCCYGPPVPCESWFQLAGVVACIACQFYELDQIGSLRRRGYWFVPRTPGDQERQKRTSIQSRTIFANQKSWSCSQRFHRLWHAPKYENSGLQGLDCWASKTNVPHRSPEVIVLLPVSQNTSAPQQSLKHNRPLRLHVLTIELLGRQHTRDLVHCLRLSVWA